MVFDFRVCQNPDCGLRYPAARGNPRGERCPVCLGSTNVAAASTAERESEPFLRGRQRTGLRAVIDNVRSALNVGSIFRSAEGYGLEHLYLCGITPGGDNPEVKKTALGAERMVAWSSHRNAVKLIESLKVEDKCIWALERTPSARPMNGALLQETRKAGYVLVVGNEQAGIDPGILELVDKVVYLEMWGRKESFNVAVAFAIAVHVMSQTEA